MTDGFQASARDIYVEANKGTLAWLLDRPRRHAGFLDSKVNSITLQDFPASDRWRGPATTYGWIQGRGLEALVAHAEFFEAEDQAFADTIHEAARLLFTELRSLYDRHGAAFFAYDEDLNPVIPDEGGRPVPQVTDSGLATYSDLFVLKGLIRAAQRYHPDSLPKYLARMADAITAIENNRFVMDEKQRLNQRALDAQEPEFGPRMIAMGAAAMLSRIGFEDQAAFGDRFIDHILERHLDPSTGLLRDAQGGGRANIGHAIEFAGFALEYLPPDADRSLVGRIADLVPAAFNAGFTGPGLCLHVSITNQRPSSPYFPWWSLPETIRAAALAHERAGPGLQMDVWRRAHEAFFTNYWRGKPALAYQTRTADGPVDYVPATSDLDPGYHTGLSLLGAIEVVDRAG